MSKYTFDCSNPHEYKIGTIFCFFTLNPKPTRDRVSLDNKKNIFTRVFNILETIKPSRRRSLLLHLNYF